MGSRWCSSPKSYDHWHPHKSCQSCGAGFTLPGDHSFALLLIHWTGASQSTQQRFTLHMHTSIQVIRLRAMDAVHRRDAPTQMENRRVDATSKALELTAMHQLLTLTVNLVEF
ncbi:hypothetical protein H257_01047 [Aphanomyces astaci]|uniref:Uncharacterized protein n=1 Tax=Aphanomyces astaci TaxID=112090 RepID=W4H641_APHAT|nr:hypothetical protein H257_01047 [Aphanomyces astaci]ETV87500.1 hypothetical protein H257_01047 [Aphanomyces astaci]|eukprot:XP_009822363.1 hypothetical protein H257_01047 [Aphanomyces astaci]